MTAEDRACAVRPGGGYTGTRPSTELSPPRRVPSANLVPDRAQAVALCPFRECSWESADLRGAPVEVQEEVVARHLLDAHEEEVRVIGLLAEDADLL